MTSFSSILGGGPRKAILAVQETFEAIVFDASVSETHSKAVDVTDHPVEVGSDISDHVRKKPDELSVNVIVTNHPPILLASLRATPISGFGDPSTRAEDAFAFLESIHDAGKLVQFTTTFKVYRNMIITSLSIPRDAARGNVADIQMSLREIIIATTLQVDPPVPTNASRSSKQNLGNKPKTVPPATSSGSTNSSDSILSDLFSSFGG